MVKELENASGVAISVNSQPAEMTRCDRMLIYLNEDTWRSPAMAEAVKAAMKQRLPLLLVHEQPGLCQAAKRACSFQQIIASTPREFVRAKIYHQIATPLSGGIYRVRSLLMLAEVLGKRPNKDKVAPELWHQTTKVVSSFISNIDAAAVNLVRHDSWTATGVGEGGAGIGTGIEVSSVSATGSVENAPGGGLIRRLTHGMAGSFKGRPNRPPPVVVADDVPPATPATPERAISEAEAAVKIQSARRRREASMIAKARAAGLDFV